MMNKEPTPVDISSLPEVLRLAEEVKASKTPRLLRRGDEAVAVLSPVHRPSRRQAKRTPTEADRQAFLSAFGGWKDNVDVARLKRDLAESRRLSRPPAEL